MTTLKEEKKKLREELLQLRGEISNDEREYAEAAVVSKLLSLASFRFAETVLLYYPIKGELNVLPIVDAAIKAGKKVAFPLCDAESSTMTYHIVSDISELKAGSYGIPEPSSELPLYTPSKEKNDLIIIPARVTESATARATTTDIWAPSAVPQSELPSTSCFVPPFRADALTSTFRLS